MKNLKIFILMTVAMMIMIAPAIMAPTRPNNSAKNAHEIMARCVKQMRTSHRLTGTMEVQIHGFGNSPSVKRIEKYRVAYNGMTHNGLRRYAVRELSFTITGPDGPDKDALALPRYYAEIIADGRRYYVLDVSKTRYILKTLHAKGVTAEEQSSGVFADYTFADILLSGGADYVKAAQAGGKYLGQQVIEGTVCDKIQIRKTNGLIWIGQKDGLIRRVESNLGTSMRLIESYTLRKIDGQIPASEFAIKPPPNAERVESL
jgi:outer membrane lipoprotein-sorting protein